MKTKKESIKEVKFVWDEKEKGYRIFCIPERIPSIKLLGFLNYIVGLKLIELDEFQDKLKEVI